MGKMDRYKQSKPKRVPAVMKGCTREILNTPVCETQAGIRRRLAVIGFEQLRSLCVSHNCPVSELERSLFTKPANECQPVSGQLVF